MHIFDGLVKNPFEYIFLIESLSGFSFNLLCFINHSTNVIMNCLVTILAWGWMYADTVKELLEHIHFQTFQTHFARRLILLPFRLYLPVSFPHSATGLFFFTVFSFEGSQPDGV